MTQLCFQKATFGKERFGFTVFDGLWISEEFKVSDGIDAVVVDVLDGHRGPVDHHLAEVVARVF